MAVEIYNNSGSRISSGIQISDAAVASAETMNVTYGGAAVYTTVSYGGKMLVSNGGTASYTDIKAGSLCVFSGGAVHRTAIDWSGIMNISSGGVASNTTVMSSGSATVSAGGKAVSTTVAGHLNISSGGTAVHTVIQNRGRANIYLGGAASDAVVQSGGVLNISSGKATDTEVHSGACVFIRKGGIASSIVVNPGGTVGILDGGIADELTVSSNVRINISSGGVIKNALIVSGGSLHISNGATASKINIMEQGSVCIFSGGTACGTTLDEGGDFYIMSGGTAVDTVVMRGGNFFVSGGGSALNVVWTPFAGTVLADDGAYVTYANKCSGVYYGISDQLCSHTGSLTGTYISRFMSMYVMSGGVGSKSIVSSGFLCVSSGGMAFDTTVSSGGSMCVYNGAEADRIILNDNGKLKIYSGASVSNLTITSRASVHIFSGGNAANVVWTPCEGSITSETGANISFASEYSGTYWGYDNKLHSHAADISFEHQGIIFVMSGGTATHNSVNSMCVSAGGIATSNIINYQCRIDVNGGIANDTLLTGSQAEMHISGGGAANRSIVSSGGKIHISSGAADKFASVFWGGNIFISSGGSGYGTVVNSGGNIDVYSGGSAGGVTVNAGGNLHIFSGGSAVDLCWIPCEGKVTVDKGAFVSYAVNYSGVYCGGENKLTSNTPCVQDEHISGMVYVMSNGSVKNSFIDSGGMVHVLSGGRAEKISVSENGSVYISSGGILVSAAADAGVIYVENGGYAGNVILNSGTLFINDGGSAVSAVVNSGGVVNISSGGFADKTNIRAKGSMYISLCGVANSTTVNSGGCMYINSGGVTKNTTVNSWGQMRIESGGVANSTTVNSNSFMHIRSGGVANSTSVNYQGYMYIWSGGVANSTTVNSCGSVYISSGGVHKGSLQIQSGALVYAYDGAKIDFTVAGRKESDDFLINDLSLISGASDYTLTVSERQKYGTYKLARGADDFRKTIFVGNGTHDFGYAAVNGAALEYNGLCYSIRELNGNLLLKINGKHDYTLSGNFNGVNFQQISGEVFLVKYTRDHFLAELQIRTKTGAVDTYNLFSGAYQWQVSGNNGKSWYEGDEFSVGSNNPEPQRIISDADGDTDIFFVSPQTIWERDYAARHAGIINGWKGTGERILLDGKNKIADVFKGSTDANILVLTDDSNGDALFVDDIYTSFGKDAARISQIDEIRAGEGDDIVDLTSQKFAYVGEGVKVYGGVGNDTIWANKGKNILFGDAGNDRIVGGSGDDVIIGGIGNDSMHGGGGEDIFTFGGNWGNDTITQLADGKVTLWFEDGSESKWNASTLTYTDGENSVKVTGIASDKISLKFGGDTSDLPDGAFAEAASEKIFEDKNKGMLA